MPQSGEFEGIPQCYGMSGMLPRMDSLTSEQMTPLDAERLAKGVRQVQASILSRLGDFHLFLVNPPERPAIKTTVGIISKPLGSARLDVAHLITALLSTNNPEINTKICELGTLPALFVSSVYFCDFYTM